MERSRWFLIGRGAIILGVINLVRLVAERAMVGSGARSTYALVLAADILLSAIAIVGGRALMKGRPWASSAIVFCAGALFISSGILSIWMWPYFMKALERGIRLSSDVLLGPRLLFYAVAVLACPYAAVVLLRRREPDWPSRGRLSAWLIGGMAGSGAWVAVLIALH
jgi:hypothetical protein